MPETASDAHSPPQQTHIPALHLTSAQVCAGAGLTYRQLDYAVRMGYVPLPNPQPGTGYPRGFTRAQAEIAAVYAGLLRQGLAAQHAGHQARHGTTLIDTTETIRLFWERLDESHS